MSAWHFLAWSQSLDPSRILRCTLHQISEIAGRLGIQNVPYTVTLSYRLYVYLGKRCVVLGLAYWDLLIGTGGQIGI